MNGVDAIILSVLVMYGLAGYLRGFLQGFAALAGLVVTLGLTWLLYPAVVPLFAGRFPKAVAPAAAFVALLAILYLAYSLFWRAAYTIVPKAVRTSPLNRAFGVVPGLLDGILMVALGLTILATLPSNRIPRDAIMESRLGGPLLAAGGAIQAKALEVFGGAVQALAPLRTVEPGEGERLRLPYHTDRGVPDPEMEKEMFVLVNRERESRGIAPLAWDDRLRVPAREHSQDMLRRGYFSHYSPEKKTVMERVKAHGVRFEMLGENLALAPTLRIGHEGLMESPGHRANILRKQFTRIGIGAIVARPYGIMFTQVFAR